MANTFMISKITNRRAYTQLLDGRVLFYGDGTRDSFCTYIGESCWDEKVGDFVSGCQRVCDSDYFPVIQKLYDRYGHDLIWVHHLTGIYNRVGNFIDKRVIRSIEAICSHDFRDAEDQKSAMFAYTVMYYGMVAEENYPTVNGQVPVCGKVIKMAGLYKYLVERMPLGTSSNPGACQCFIGVNPQQVLREAASYGIFRHVAVYQLP